MTHTNSQSQDPAPFNLANSTVGIWGYGIGGKATANFVAAHGAHVVVFDTHPFDEHENALLHKQQAHVCTSLDEFFEKSTLIVPSAGVDLRTHRQRKHLFVSELDIFGAFFRKPIIAVTGSLGKTTVTTLITNLLERAGKRVLVGGNIGTPMCSLISQQENVDYAVLEVSSFQLEPCRSFAPHVGVWTNFYPNHLDRHLCMDEYFAAKGTLFAYQQSHDWAIMPPEIYTRISAQQTCPQQFLALSEQIQPAWQNFVDRQTGFTSNWITALSVLDTLKIALPTDQSPCACTIEHRLELVDTVGGVMFYNDSKATIAQATLAAVQRLQPRPVILLLGGLSKGVNRQPLVQALRGQVEHVICFGAEADTLATWCQQENIPCTMCSHFDEIVVLGYTYGKQKSDSVVVLSPGGSSFDLFKNYQERGMRFKDLVRKLKETV